MPINELNELKESFINSLTPLKIYLFGSFAERKQSEDSDFDFYIVVNDSEKDMIKLTSAAYKSIRHKQKRAVDIIVNTNNTFENRIKNSISVEHEVAEKGVLLYGY